MGGIELVCIASFLSSGEYDLLVHVYTCACVCVHAYVYACMCV